MIFNTLLRMARPYARRLKCTPCEVVGVIYICGATGIARWDPDKGVPLDRWLNTPNFRKRVWAHLISSPPPRVILPRPSDEGSSQQVSEEVGRLMGGLSSREAEVCGFLARGLTQGQIARVLGVTPSAVNQTITRLRKRKVQHG